MMNPFIDNVQIFERAAAIVSKPSSRFNFLNYVERSSVAVTAIAIGAALFPFGKSARRAHDDVEEEECCCSRTVMHPGLLTKAKVETPGIATYDLFSDRTRPGIITRKNNPAANREECPPAPLPKVFQGIPCSVDGNTVSENGYVFFTGLVLDICPNQKSLMSCDKTKTDLSTRRRNPFDNGFSPPAETNVDKPPNRLPQDGRGSERDEVGGEDVRICPSCGNQMPVFIFGEKRSGAKGLQFEGAGPSRKQNISAATCALEEANRTSESAYKPRPKEDASNGSQFRTHPTPPKGKKRSRRRANRNRTSFKPAQGRGRQLELDPTEARADFAEVTEAPRELMYLGTEDV